MGNDQLVERFCSGFVGLVVGLIVSFVLYTKLDPPPSMILLIAIPLVLAILAAIFSHYILEVIKGVAEWLQ